jgi:transcriptional regulator with XRE-family HTH domain
MGASVTVQERAEVDDRPGAGDATAAAATAPITAAPITAEPITAEPITAERAEAEARALTLRNVARQRELYGEPLGDRIRRLQAALGVSQARIAEGLGLSTAMLSQLVSARRVKIGDPAVLARLTLLDRHVRRLPAGETIRAHELLAQLRQARPHLGLPGGSQDPGEALRAVAAPAQLAAAASVLGPRFPAIAELLRRAAVERR